MTEGELKGSGSGTLRAGENAAGVATLTKLFLTVVKGLVGFLTGSVALLADALNSGVDVIVSSVSWVSLRLVQRSPDEEFQYGYYKVENLAAL
ncbi:MAG: cation transporter, partial [Methanomassiliicoccales archaeon]